MFVNTRQRLRHYLFYSDVLNQIDKYIQTYYLYYEELQFEFKNCFQERSLDLYHQLNQDGSSGRAPG